MAAQRRSATELQHAVADYFLRHKPDQGIRNFDVAIDKNGMVSVKADGYFSGRQYTRTQSVAFPTPVSHRSGARSGRGTREEAMLIAGDALSQILARPKVPYEVAFENAKQAALVAAQKVGSDGGSSNFDAVEVKRTETSKWTRLWPPFGGQGYLRTAQAEAMAESFKKDGYQARVHYALD